MACILAVLLATSCSKNSPVSEGNNAVEIKLGTPSTYEVAGTSKVAVEDSVSGCTFLFPDGGSGTLSVAPVLSSPTLNYPSTKIAVEYSGDENLEIAVPHTEGNEDILFVYTQYPHIAVDDVTVDETWWGIAPSEQRNDATVFSISSFFAAELTSKRAQTTANTTVVLAISSISPGSPVDVKMDALRESLKQAVDWWLDNLPPALAASTRTQVEGDLRYGVTWANDGNAYDHTRHTFGPDAVFELNVNGNPETRANNHTIAHEVGHYMTHVLVGYDRYVEILDRMPTNWYGRIIDHGFTEYFEFRKYLVEEYAYLSDYLITGSVDSNDLKAPIMTTIFGEKGPDEKDFPSFEGFGSVMFGSLLRTDPKVKSFWKKEPLSDAPVVGAPAADVLGIFARGARDTNELRQHIQDYLDSRGNADRFKLPAMLEPLGWSYNGNGLLVDKAGVPVKGAHVQSISQDGTKEYRTFMSPLTGDDGKFYLPRIFPGTNILRLYWNGDKDSTDVSFTADWSKPTNASLDLGKITVGDMLSTRQLTAKHVHEFKYGDDIIASVTVTATADVTGYGLKSYINYDGQPSDNMIYISAGMPATVKITASSTIEVVNSGFGSKDDYYIGWTFGKTRYVFQTDNYNTAVSLRESISGNTYTGDFTFKEGDNFGVGVKAFVEDTNEIYDKGKLTESYTGEYYASGVGYQFFTKSAFSDWSK